MKTYQLPKEFATKWVEALRSGEYKQGRFRLIDEDGGYCCLGVACKIANVPENALMKQQWIGDKLVDFGIPKEIIGNGNNELVDQLSDMNDKVKMSFPEIADWIETNVEFI